jgi:putative thioredoxin
VCGTTLDIWPITSPLNAATSRIPVGESKDDRAREYVGMSTQPPIRGGIDLAALAAQREALAKAEASKATAPDGVIVTISEENFQTAVIEQSMTLPVIVVVGSARSAGSVQLTAVLETVVAQAGGKVVLAEVDADTEQRIAMAFRVEALPSVYAVIGGQVLPLFQGPVPESQAQAYIVEVLKAAQESGLTGRVGAVSDIEDEAEEVVDPRFDAAADAIEAGEWATAIGTYESILSDNPADEWATAALSQVRLMQRTDGVDLEAAIAAAAANPGEVAAATVGADALVIRGDVEQAFSLLVEAVRRSSGDDRNAAREHLVDLFEIVGPDHAAVAPARIALSNALF